MKRRRERSAEMRAMRLWELSEVTKAVPYLHSIIGSLREHWLDVLSAQRQLELADKSDRSPTKRQQLLATAARQDERGAAQTKFDAALDELNDIDVFLLDAVQGLALIPFRKDDDLAWYVFDHFTPAGAIGWRYHSDPIEECRPLGTLRRTEPQMNPDKHR